MRIILNQDVYNLGEEGDVCVVASGYARNFLIPQKMAVLFNKQNNAIFESRKVSIEKRKEEKHVASASLKERIEAITLELLVSTGETGKLFGSVTTANIVEELKKSGIIIERKKIELPDHTIKTIGEFIAKIKLYGSVSADLRIVIKSDKVITEPIKKKKTTIKDEKIIGKDFKGKVEKTDPKKEITEINVLDSTDEA